MPRRCHALNRFALLVFLSPLMTWHAPAMTIAQTGTPDKSLKSDNESGVFRVGAKLTTPKNGKDKRMSKPLDEAPMAIWIPPDVKTLRGAVVNPFYEKTVHQAHWRAAVSQWDFALVGANLFGVKKDEHADTIARGLEQLGKVSGHPELKHAPLCFVGMSIGGGLSSRLTEAMPNRTIAAAPVCLEVGPRDEASRRVPMVTIFGERDGKQMEKLFAKLPDQRAQHAQWSIAVQWRKKHEFARANNLAMPWFDHAIRVRYPASQSPAEGPVTLKTLDVSKGWLGNADTWSQQPPDIASFNNYKGDKSKACWFPNRYLAATWRSFVSKDSPIQIKQPIGMGDGGFVAHQAGEPIKVIVNVKPPWNDATLVLHTGDKELTLLNGSEVNVKLKPGIHALHVHAMDSKGNQAVSPLNTIIVVDK